MSDTSHLIAYNEIVSICVIIELISNIGERIVYLDAMKYVENIGNLE